MTFADRLAAGVRRSGPLCVGLDPRWESLPKSVRETYRDLPPGDRAAGAVLEFGLKVLELVAPHAAIVKPQAAFFENLGPSGFRVLQELLIAAKSLGLITLLDAKRGDIASTATAYADAAFAGTRIDGEAVPVWDADACTVNPYLGADAVEPFIAAATVSNRGLFVLVRTSNPGAGLFQDLSCDGLPLYRHVAKAVAGWNHPTLGECGFGTVGAVVGATHPAELAELRSALPECWLLVPGYGAQGGTAADTRAAFRSDGLGAIINSSRGITFPFHPNDPDWETKITTATIKSAHELTAAAKG